MEHILLLVGHFLSQTYVLDALILILGTSITLSKFREVLIFIRVMLIIVKLMRLYFSNHPLAYAKISRLHNQLTILRAQRMQADKKVNRTTGECLDAGIQGNLNVLPYQE